MHQVHSVQQKHASSGLLFTSKAWFCRMVIAAHTVHMQKALTMATTGDEAIIELC
jgi:hypothetical protein